MMNYQTMKIEDIISWCKANKETAWLKAEAAKLVDYKVYPKATITNPDGTTSLVTDKTKAPTIEKRPISFMQIKRAFCEKFMPDILPKAQPKKKTMYEIIAEL